MKKRDNKNLKSLEDFGKAGYFDDFSEEHFIKRVISGNADLPDKFQNEIFQICKRDGRNRVGIDSDSFYASFSARLSNMLNLFDESAIKKFVEAQLSAGKDNYSEDTFFQAISEVSCINYVANIVPDSENIYVEYEPKTNGKKNPEARIVASDDLRSNHNYDFRYDIEVKTPMFKDIVLEPRKKYVKVNIPLSEAGRKYLKEGADKSNYNIIWPNFYKIRDFINSAGSKFIEPSNKNEVNILFINWSFIEPKSSKIMEPCSFLLNKKNGILRNTKCHGLVGIDIDMLKRISAIVVYCDNYDSFIGQNLLSAIHTGLCKIIFNDIFCKYIDKNRILSDLRIPEATYEEVKPFEVWGNLASGMKKDIEEAAAISKVCTELYANE